LLDLHVVVDANMPATAKTAHYVIASTPQPRTA
jgi:hypothetical protein